MLVTVRSAVDIEASDGFAYSGALISSSPQVWGIAPCVAGGRQDGKHFEQIPAGVDTTVESLGIPARVRISGSVLAGEQVSRASATHYKRRAGGEIGVGFALENATDSFGNVLIKYGEEMVS